MKKVTGKKNKKIKSRLLGVSKRKETPDYFVAGDKNQSISPLLSVAINKILERSALKKAFAIEGNPTVETQSEEKEDFTQVVLPKNKEKEFNINIAHHLLDQYSSPFTLDLSNLKNIEKISCTSDTSDCCEKLPGEDVLQRLHLLEFWSLDQSEIVQWLSSFWRQFRKSFRSSIQSAEFSVKLPLVRTSSAYGDFLQVAKDLTLVSLFVQGIEFYYQLFCKFDESLQPIRNLLNFNDFSLKNDEIVNLQPVMITEKIMPSLKKPNSAKKIEKKNSISIRYKPNFSFFVKLSDSLKASLQKLAIRLVPLRKLNISNDAYLLQLKPVLVFFLIAIIIIAPIKMASYWNQLIRVKGLILGEAESALSALSSAGSELKNFNLDSAESYLSQANSKFITAQKQLDEVKSFVTFLAEAVPANNSFKSGKNLLELGEHLTKAGEHLLKGTQDATADSELSLSSRLNNFKIESVFALRELEQSQENLKEISPDDLPSDRQKQYLQFRDNLPLLISSLKKTEEVIDFTISLIGNNEFKRYLLIFQNDNELRATGGFMGSYALMDIRNGKIENISLPSGGTYDLRAGTKLRLEPPDALRLVSPRWEFQDANWWPDWPTSAAYLNWFYNKSGGPTIDGVIAINSNWLGGLLGIVGPIELEEFNKVITADNFEMELQKSIEIEASREKPKAILSALAPILLEKILNTPSAKFLDLAKIINSGLTNKDILIYLNDEQLRGFVAKNNWDGRQKSTDDVTDYLQVVSTNIGGGKTDNVIRQKIYHRSEIQPDGSIIDTLIINRFDFGPTDEYFSEQINNSYLRIYVPQGSQLIKAAGFSEIGEQNYKALQDDLELPELLKDEKNAEVDSESRTKIYNENSKTVFANWTRIGPRSSKEIILMYKLPFKIPTSDSGTSALSGLISSLVPQYLPYKLLIQKQSGRNNDEIISQIDYPSNWLPEAVFPGSIEQGENQLISNSTTLNDNFYLAAFKLQK